MESLPRFRQHSCELSSSSSAAGAPALEGIRRPKQKQKGPGGDVINLSIQSFFLKKSDWTSDAPINVT